MENNGTTRAPPASIHFTYDAGKYEVALEKAPQMNESHGGATIPIIGSLIDAHNTMLSDDSKKRNDGAIVAVVQFG